MTLLAPSAKALYNEFAIPAFDEAALLYHQRRHKCARRFGVIKDVADVDQRLQYNLDHLRYFRDAAKFLCEERYDLGDEADAFVATHLSFQFDDSAWIQQVFAAYLQHEHTRQALAEALAWMPWSVSGPWIKRFLSSKDLQHKALALRVCSQVNQFPREMLDKFMQREDCLAHPQLLPALLRVIGQTKNRSYLKQIYQACENDDSTIRNAGCQAGLLMADTHALNIAMKASLASNEHFQLLGPLILRAQSIEASQAWFTQVLNSKDLALELKILAVGDYGDPRGIPWLIKHMDHAQAAPFAAWAFRQITGADLVKHKLIKTDEELAQLKLSQSEIAGENEGDSQAFLNEDNSLLFPDRTHMHAFWSAYNKHFIPGQRYVLGRQHMPTDLRYLEYLNSLRLATNMGDRMIARHELAQLSTEPASSDFIGPQHRNQKG